MHFSKRDQQTLLKYGLEATGALAFHKDAIAFGIYPDQPTDDVVTTLQGVGVFQDFTAAEDAELHIGMFDGKPMNRTIIKAFTNLAFHPRLFNLQRLWVSISEDNATAQAAAVRVGFRFEFRKRGGFMGGKDAILLAMERPSPILAAAKRNETEEVGV